ncbi:MAG: tyrosine-type recombinase/integrase [Acidimicrobiia bacterium]
MNGSIQYRPGRPSPWRARYRGADGRQHSKSFARKVDAERWLRAEVGKLDRGEWLDPSAGLVTFAEWAEGWLPGLDLKPKTRAGYESLLRSRVLPTFGAVPLRRIAPTDLREWVATMVDEGLSASRIRQALQVIRAALEAAVGDGLIARNPTANVPVAADRPRAQRYLTADEVSTLAEAAEVRQTGAGVLVRFLAYSGLRWGEAVALRRSSCDLLRRRVRVAESATEIASRVVVGSPKSHRERSVILPRFMVDRLSEHLASQSPQSAESPDGGRVSEGLVFSAPRGGFLRVSNFRRAVWLPAVETAGIEPGLRVHDLRHTAASLMISAGASIKAVQTALGHSSVTITLDRYSHLYEDDLEALAEALHSRFADSDVAQVWPKPVGGVRELRS